MRVASGDYVAPVLPRRVLDLINPRVLAERRRRIAEHAQNEAEERDRRRRCAEIIASYLLVAEEKHG